MLRMLVAIATLSLAACSSTSDKQNNAWDLNDAPDMSTHDGGMDGASIEFRLVNRSNEPLFAYHSGGGCSLGSFIQVLDPDTQPGPLQSDCLMCACDEEVCATCDVDCAPGAELNDVEFGNGDVRSFTWDGLFRAQGSHPNGGTCAELQAPQSEVLTARFCWGRGFSMFEEQPWGEVTAIECEDVEFSLDDEVVELEIEPSIREGIRFEMVNASDTQFHASVGFASPCAIGEWLKVSQDGEQLLLVQACGECVCNDVDASSVCPQPCPAAACAGTNPEFYEFPPGDTRLFDWNGAHFISAEVEGVMCIDDRRIIGEATATFCWATGLDERNRSLIGETCESVTFDAQVDTLVRFEVDG